MLVNVIKILALLWVLRLLFRWYQGYRENQRRKEYDAGRRAAKDDSSRRKPDDQSLGEYVDYEEVK